MPARDDQHAAAAGAATALAGEFLLGLQFVPTLLTGEMNRHGWLLVLIHLMLVG